MLPWQKEYIGNAREAAALWDEYTDANQPFEVWQRRRAEALARIEELKEKSTAILNDCFFLALDTLHSVGEDEIAALCEFADQLLDWKTNLDVGVYIAIHEALLRMYRVRKDRTAIIRELYKLGMGLYYRRRMLLAIEDRHTASFHFQNEMVFTEAASYFRYFDQFQDEETQGYIIRSIANIALCVRGAKAKINASAKVLKIIRDEHYRALAPGLPWDWFLRGTHQQMSSNRFSLSRGDLTDEELSEVLDSCYEVFKPEKAHENPSVRWLWPYYEMEYNCGYATLEETVPRLERLISSTPVDQYDDAGLYGNVLLPITYGKLLRQRPMLLEKKDRIAFLDRAYRKMERCLLTFPSGKFNDFLLSSICQPFAQYNDIDGVLPYQEIILHVMQRYSGRLYRKGRRIGRMMKLLTEALLHNDASFFDDIPFVSGLSGPDKVAALLIYAYECGPLLDVGLSVMNTERLLIRGMFESENSIYQLHPAAGANLLREHSSTARYADVVLGHHAWYNSMGGYPAGYVRTDSPFRQMTDVAAVAAFIADRCEEGMDSIVSRLYEGEGRQFSPLVLAVLSDNELLRRLSDALYSQDTETEREIYETLNAYHSDNADEKSPTKTLPN